MKQETLIAYIGCVLALAVAAAMLVKGSYPQASVLAALAAFLIYWARKGDVRGDR